MFGVLSYTPASSYPPNILRHHDLSGPFLAPPPPPEGSRAGQGVRVLLSARLTELVRRWGFDGSLKL